MANWEVERTSRTAFPVSSGAPAGVSALMPPHSQGAERRTERRARHAGSRWGLRALVIGGLAGAAWLLTGAAAHAADHHPAPGGVLGPGLIGSALPGDIAQPAVGQVLQAAAQPLESDRTALRQYSASVLGVPVRVLARPAAALTHQDRLVREITGPLRLTGGPADSPLAPVTAPLTRTLGSVVKTLSPMTGTVSPVRGILPQAPKPAMTAQRPVTGTQPHMAMPAAAEPVAVSGAAELFPLGGAVSQTRHSVSSERDTRIIAHRHVVAAAAGTPETIRESTPGGDGPAPLQVHLGAVSGTSTSASGSPAGGGSVAFLPAAVTASSMAFHRLPRATDVEVRRHDAEAPTVSPD